MKVSEILVISLISMEIWQSCKHSIFRKFGEIFHIFVIFSLQI
jgi:hypothetical protein